MSESTRQSTLSSEELSGFFAPLLGTFFDKLKQANSWSARYTPINRGWAVTIRTSERSDPRGTTHADVNILDGVFYLLHIELRSEDRGRGVGEELYQLFEFAARCLKCRRIEQTPSGWTKTGETRASYLERRGWTIDGNIAFKTLD